MNTNKNNHLTKDVVLLRLNDLNNKVKNLDRKMSYMVEKMEYNNIILNEVKDELANTNNISPMLNRSISPIYSPRYNMNSRNSMVAQKAEETYLGGVPTFKSLRNSPTFLPTINTNPSSNKNVTSSPNSNTNTHSSPNPNTNPKNRNRSKSNIVSRRSFDSLSSYNF